MTCDMCGVDGASIHLTEIVNGKMLELHLCESCANEKEAGMKLNFPVTDLLAGLADMSETGKAKKKTSPGQCPHCGMSVKDFGKCGRLGCAKCYEHFATHLNVLIKRVQKNVLHSGKRPHQLADTPSICQQVQELRLQLDKAIRAEDFEKAAHLRDQIRKMEEQISTSNDGDS